MELRTSELPLKQIYCHAYACGWMQANAAASESAKRLKSAESGNADLQRRYEDLDRELKTAQGDVRRLQEEITALKKTNDDLQAKLDALTRENNKLTGTTTTLLLH